jgi:hypothetical protein
MCSRAAAAEAGALPWCFKSALKTQADQADTENLSTLYLVVLQPSIENHFQVHQPRNCFSAVAGWSTNSTGSEVQGV